MACGLASGAATDLLAAAEGQLDLLFVLAHGAGQDGSGNEPVVVATPRTLRGERLARFARDAFGFVVLDEAQHA